MYYTFGLAKNPKLAIIFNQPTGLDLRRMNIMWGKNADFLSQLLDELGCPLEECYVTYAIRETTTLKDIGEKNAPPFMRENHESLITELERVNPSKILVMGNLALAVLRGLDKPVAMAKERGLGEWTTLPNGKKVYTVNTYPTYMVFKDNSTYRDVKADIIKLLAHSKPLDPPNVELHIPQTAAELKVLFEELNNFPYVSCDLETTGLSAIGDEITAIGFGIGLDVNIHSKGIKGHGIIVPYHIIYQDDVREVVRDFVSGKTFNGTLVFHNAMFDLQFLTYYLGVSLLDIKIDDTILINYLLDERSIGGETGRGVSPHGLKTLSRSHFDQPDYHFSFTEWMKKEKHERDYDSLYTYLGLDLIYTIQLYYILHKLVDKEDKNLWTVYNRLLIPGTKTFAEISLEGAPVDMEYLANLVPPMEQDIADIGEQLRSIVSSLSDDSEFIENFNPASSQQITTVLYDLMSIPVPPIKTKSKSGVSVNMDFLSYISKQYSGTIADKFIQLLVKHRSTSKILGTYVHGLLESAKYDGNVHGSYRLNGTVTGRISSGKPSMQTFPSHSGYASAIKKAFNAPEGFIFVGADQSQVEWRITADISNDTELINLYANKIDLHRYVASLVLEKPMDEITDDERQVSKQIGFSILYGKSSKGLSETLTAKLGPTWTVEKVEEVLKKFLAQYKGIDAWMKKIKAEAYNNEYIMFSLGRRRRFPYIDKKNYNEIMRQAVNTPPQGTASDITFNAVIGFHRDIKKLGGRIVMVIHDSIEYIVPIQYAKQANDLLRFHMLENLPFPVNCPLEVDVKMGKNWDELIKEEKWLKSIQTAH